MFSNVCKHEIEKKWSNQKQVNCTLNMLRMQKWTEMALQSSDIFVVGGGGGGEKRNGGVAGVGGGWQEGRREPAS